MTAQQLAEVVAPPAGQGNATANGRYLARTICAQCHGPSLRGYSTPDFTAPSLQAVNAYSEESFSQLMKTGVALGGRSLATMSPWSRRNLSHLTDQEIADLFSYLHTMQ